MINTIITRKTDNVVTNIATSTEVVENGLLVDNLYIIAGIDNYNMYFNIDSIDIEIEKYTYTYADKFVKNPNYIEPIIEPIV